MTGVCQALLGANCPEQAYLWPSLTQVPCTVCPAPLSVLLSQTYLCLAYRSLRLSRLSRCLSWMDLGAVTVGNSSPVSLALSPGGRFILCHSLHSNPVSGPVFCCFSQASLDTAWTLWKLSLSQSGSV